VIVLNTNDVKIEARMTVVGVPKEMYVEYFGVTADGVDFVIMRPEKDWDYNSFVCLMGSPLASVKIHQVTRYRDGGTTDVKTERGNFHFPSPFENQVPTFDGKPLTCHETT
jgi:hypothetical protein